MLLAIEKLTQGEKKVEQVLIMYNRIWRILKIYRVKYPNPR